MAARVPRSLLQATRKLSRESSRFPRAILHPEFIVRPALRTGAILGGRIAPRDRDIDAGKRRFTSSRADRRPPLFVDSVKKDKKDERRVVIAALPAAREAAKPLRISTSTRIPEIIRANIPDVGSRNRGA